MNLKCLLFGHFPAFDYENDYFKCVRCGKLLIEQTGGNTRNPPPDGREYEKRCRFCDVLMDDEHCPKCNTILYEWKIKNDTKKNRKKVHIIPRKNKWVVKKHNHKKALKVCSEKIEAINLSERYYRDGYDVIIHKNNGDIEEWKHFTK